jgi:hypothetical protein
VCASKPLLASEECVPSGSELLVAGSQNGQRSGLASGICSDRARALDLFKITRHRKGTLISVCDSLHATLAE